MKTRIAKLMCEEALQTEEGASVIEEAGEIIRRGGLVAFPTETVYGLGADAVNKAAAKKIYEAKGRPSDNPLIVHIAYISQLAEIAGKISPEMKALSDAFWPGPLTMIVNQREGEPLIPRETTGGLSTVAVRFPSHPIANALIRESGRMIAAPSANLSGRPSPTTGQHVIEDLDGKVDMIIDSGSVDIGLESTIIDLTGDVPMVLRPGYITRDELSKVLGAVELDPAVAGIEGSAPPKAPGMRYRHYAPKAHLTIVEKKSDLVESLQERIINEALTAMEKGLKTAIICADENAHLYEGLENVKVYDIGRFSDDDEIAGNLFSVLRKCDEDGMERIFSESFDTPRLGGAIMNRLLKAAGHDILEI